MPRRRTLATVSCRRSLDAQCGARGCPCPIAGRSRRHPAAARSMPAALRHPACACRQRRLRGTGNPSWIISPTKFSAAPVLWGSWSFAVSEMCVRRGGERARATGSWSGVARSRRCILTGRVGAPFAWSMRRQNPPAASTCPRPAAFLGPAANGRKLEVARAPSPDARYGILPPLARCPMRGSGLPVPHRRTLAAASCRRSLDAGSGARATPRGRWQAAARWLACGPPPEKRRGTLADVPAADLSFLGMADRGGPAGRGARAREGRRQRAA